MNIRVCTCPNCKDLQILPPMRPSDIGAAIACVNCHAVTERKHIKSSMMDHELFCEIIYQRDRLRKDAGDLLAAMQETDDLNRVYLGMSDSQVTIASQAIDAYKASRGI